MFKLGFTSKDLVRSAWSFVFGVAGYVAVTQNAPANWKAFAAGAIMAGLAAVKNLIFADGSTVKG